MEFLIDSFESVWTTSDSVNLSVVTSVTYVIEGSYSMQVSGTTSSSGVTLTKDLGSSRLIDLNQYSRIGFYIKSNLIATPGSGNTATTVFMKFGFSKDNIIYTEFQISIKQTMYPEYIAFDISEISKTLRDDVRYFKFTVVNQSRTFLLYLDELLAYDPELFFDIERKIKSKLENVIINNEQVKINFVVSEKISEISFPSLSVSLLDLFPDYIRESEEEEINRNADDTDVRVYEAPKAWNIIYEIKTFADKNHHDRLLQQQLIKEFPSRGYLSVRGKIYPTTFSSWNTEDEFTEERIFSKSFAYEVEAYADEIYLRDEKLVLELARNYFNLDGSRM